MSELTPAQWQLARAMSEDQLADAVLKYARTHGWRCHHTRASPTGRWYTDRHGELKQRWVTALQGDAGFPDWVFARPPRFLLVELKKEMGTLTDAETQWWTVLQPLHQAGKIEYYIWRPSHWLSGEIERILT